MGYSRLGKVDNGEGSRISGGPEGNQAVLLMEQRIWRGTFNEKKGLEMGKYGLNSIFYLKKIEKFDQKQKYPGLVLGEIWLLSGCLLLDL